MTENVNSIIAESVKLYKDTRIRDSFISEDCSIGDFALIVESKLEPKVEIKQNNMLFRVKIGEGSYTGRNTTLKVTEIGKFCSISWNVTIFYGAGNYKAHNPKALSTYPGYIWENLYNKIRGGV